MEETQGAFDYTFLSTSREKEDVEAPCTQDPSVDGEGNLILVYLLDLRGDLRNVKMDKPEAYNEVGPPGTRM